MISLSQYFGKFAKHKDLTPSKYANAQRLLTRVNALIAIAIADGVVFKINPKTKSNISGEQYGGFRPNDCPIGTPSSAHKTCEAVDIYDPDNSIDVWLNASEKARDAMKELGLYFEASSYTIGWSHWSIRRPASGNRFFKP